MKRSTKRRVEPDSVANSHVVVKPSADDGRAGSSVCVPCRRLFTGLSALDVGIIILCAGAPWMSGSDGVRAVRPSDDANCEVREC